MADPNMLAAFLGGGGSNSRGYADLNDFQSTIQANDPYRMAAAPVLGAKFNTSTWSPMETLGVTAGQSFLGAALNALGSRNEASQLNSLAGVLPQLYSNPASVRVPVGVDAEAFGRLKASALKENAIKSNDESKDLTKLKANLFADMFSRNPSIAVSTMPDMAKKLDVSAPELLGSTDPLANIPSRLQDTAIKEAERVGAKKASLDFIKQKFEQAKKLTGGMAALNSITGIPTDKGQELKALGDSIVLQIDSTQKREMNSDVRNRILALGPQWYDSPETLDRKSRDMMDLVNSLGESTPVLDTYLGSQRQDSTGSQAQPKLKASDLLKQGYKKGPNGWIPPGAVGGATYG